MTNEIVFKLSLIAAADNCTANMMAMVYRDEAKSIRALLPKEES